MPYIFFGLEIHVSYPDDIVKTNHDEEVKWNAKVSRTVKMKTVIDRLR